MANETAVLGPYLDRLRELPFVTDIAAEKGPKGGLRLEIRTPSKPFHLSAVVRPSFLTVEVVDNLIAQRGNARDPWILMAPAVSAAIASRLVEAGVNFIDRDGNCFLRFDTRYIARIQRRERAVHRTAAERGLRAPAYQTLFALLAEPSLMGATVRELADSAGVSRETAHALRPRLVTNGLAVETKGRFAWIPHRLSAAFDLWIAGYGSVLRPSLLVGRYRTADRDPTELEKRIAATLADEVAYAWGGGAAAERLENHYRGPLTVVHLVVPEHLPRLLRLVPDANGPLIFLRAFGPLSMRGAAPHTVHPLLVYAELLAEGNERAREAAAEILRAHTSYGGTTERR